MLMTTEMEKALEDIVKNFLLHETKSGQSDDQTLVENPVKEDDKNNNSGDQDADEFVKNLYNCLAERGILRELHAFLRQRLVEILKGTYPNLVVSGCSENFDRTTVKLFEDFLCCHKLLFTLSVLVTETDNRNYAFRRDGFGKMQCKDAENLLDDLNIKKDSDLSRQILKLYSEKEHSSLLECIIGVSSWGQQQPSYSNNDGQLSSDWQFLFTNDKMTEGNNKIFTPVFDDSKNISDKLRQVDYEFAERLNPTGGPSLSTEGADSQFIQMQLIMEKDKQLQIKNAMQKFRDEEIAKIRDEIETRTKFQMISKEKELLRNYEERVSHMKKLLEREKDIWFAEKARKEKELFTQRQDLVKLMEHVKEKKIKLKEALEKIECGKEAMGQSNVCTGNNNNMADSSIGSEGTSSSDKEHSLKFYNLESTIKRLQEENLQLQKKLSKQSRIEQFPKYEKQRRDHYFDSPPEDNISIKSVRSGINDDKIAILQYTVEKQTEELEKLKQQLKCDNLAQSSGKQQQQQRLLIPPEVSSPNFDFQNPTLSDRGDNDLETFLAESKRRFDDIEKKAELVGSSLREVFKRNSGGGVDLNSQRSTTSVCPSTVKPIIPPSVPKFPPSLQKKPAGRLATNSQTKSILAPRFMSTTTSSIDQALKSFLLNQAEDPFHSKVPAIFPESSSNHVKFLQTSSSIVFQQPLPNISSSSSTTHKASRGEEIYKQPSPNLIIENGINTKSTIEESQKETQQASSSSPIIIPNSSSIPVKHTVTETMRQPVIATTTVSAATPIVESKVVESQAEKITSIEVSSETASVTKDDDDISHISPSKLASKTNSPIKTPIVERIQVEVAGSSNISEHHNGISISKSIEAAAGGSGALIQSKVPSPDNSQQHALTSTKLQRNGQRSWGDILSAENHKTKPHQSMSSSNSISFADGGGMEDEDFMAEEDFWIL